MFTTRFTNSVTVRWSAAAWLSWTEADGIIKPFKQTHSCLSLPLSLVLLPSSTTKSRWIIRTFSHFSFSLYIFTPTPLSQLPTTTSLAGFRSANPYPSFQFALSIRTLLHICGEDVMRVSGRVWLIYWIIIG